MTYKVPERIYRTTDGRLVRHGDPESAFLAYIEGEELADEEAKQVGLVALFEKKREQPQDKLGARPADKSGAQTEEPKEAPVDAPESGQERRRPGRPPGRTRHASD